MDVVCREMLEPCLGAFRKVEWQVLDDEEVIVCPACSTGVAKVFQPHDRVGVPGVLDDIQRCTETCWERRLPDPLHECLRAASIQARIASSISDPGVSAMVVWVTIIIVQQILTR